MATDAGRLIDLVGREGLLDPNTLSQDAIQQAIEAGGVALFQDKDSVENMNQKVDAAIDQYYHAIANSQGPDDALVAIVQLVKMLEVSHFFTDANCRTSVCLVMNKLLLENGFSPAMFHNPNRIDGFSVAEVVTDVKMAMSQFQSYCIRPETKMVLSHVELEDLKLPKQLCAAISETLSPEPLQAMAQLDHLCEHLEQYLDATSLSSAHQSAIPLFQDARNSLQAGLMNSLKDEFRGQYVETLRALVDRSAQPAPGDPVSNKALLDVIGQHKIIATDTRTAGSMLEQISEILSDHARGADAAQNQDQDFEGTSFKL